MLANETKIDKGMKVADILRNCPWTISVFNRYAIETCCKGQQTIEAVAAENGIPLEELVESLKDSH